MLGNIFHQHSSQHQRTCIPCTASFYNDGGKTRTGGHSMIFLNAYLSGSFLEIKLVELLLLLHLIYFKQDRSLWSTKKSQKKTKKNKNIALTQIKPIINLFPFLFSFKLCWLHIEALFFKQISKELLQIVTSTRIHSFIVMFFIYLSLGGEGVVLQL